MKPEKYVPLYIELELSLPPVLPPKASEPEEQYWSVITIDLDGETLEKIPYNRDPQ